MSQTGTRSALAMSALNCIGQRWAEVVASLRPLGRGKMKMAVRTAVAALVAVLAASTPVCAQADLKVFADTPLRAALIQIAEAFRRDGGPQIDFVFGPSPVILKELADGEAADVLIAQPHHIAELVKAGKIVPGDYPVLGRVGLGLAVRADAPPQRIDTVEALREVLLNADTLRDQHDHPGRSVRRSPRAIRHCRARQGKAGSPASRYGTLRKSHPRHR